LPSEVRATLEERLGSSVAEAATQPKGFSPGLAARLRLADGRRVFIKAVSEAANLDSPAIHRREARNLAAIPVSSPVPRLLWSCEYEGWVALCMEDVDGRHPGEPWTDADLNLVLDCLRRMAEDLTPSPIASLQPATTWFAQTINGWRIALDRAEDRLDPWVLAHLPRLAELESLAPDAAAGDTLLHCDVRADNLLIAGDHVYVVDWPWARTGAWWIDAASMAPSVAMQGGPPPETVLAKFGVEGVDAGAIDAVVCALAGYFTVSALEPPPPGLPTVRAFQAAQGREASSWLRERLGWD
jgi:aminoglycoside phosphotransferase (APT) family kinase protein